MAIPKEILKKSMKTFNLTQTDWAYLAGFIDGHGSVLTQIVRRKDYKLGFQIRTSLIFYQSKKRHWFILQLHKLLHKKGYLRIRNDHVSELTIIQKPILKELLVGIYPYAKAKKTLIKLTLQILDHNPKTQADFLEVCKLVDKTAELRDSKKRKITSDVVKDFFNLPVETSIL